MTSRIPTDHDQSADTTDAHKRSVTGTSVEVLLFAGLKAAAGCDRIRVHCPSGPLPLAQLRVSIVAALPQARGLILASRFAVGHSFVTDDYVLDLGSQAPNPITTTDPIGADLGLTNGAAEDPPEIALIPPVSGGHDGPRPSEDGTAEVDLKAVLTLAALELAFVEAAVNSLAAGAVVSFVGAVREQSRGLVVTHLEYEAYPSMALRVMRQIIWDLEQHHVGVRVAIHHRLGRVELGEAAVIIVAAAPHRAEAFDACRAAIERLKREVPIWKKEFDVDGGTWISQGP